MTTTPNKSDLPVYDFSTSPEDRANEQAAIDKAIKDAEAAMKAPAAKKQTAPAAQRFKDALVAESIAAKPLIKKAKAPAKARGSKSGRVVGISADENKMLQSLLQTVQEDSNYSIISSSESFKKLQARYNNN